MSYTLLCVECIREIRHIRNKHWYIEHQIQQHYPYCVCGVVFLCVYRWLVQWWLSIRLVHDKFLSSMGTHYEFCGLCASRMRGGMMFGFIPLLGASGNSNTSSNLNRLATLFFLPAILRLPSSTWRLTADSG